jgi:hypothetical protein
MHGPDVLWQSNSAYTTERWGDYSATVADPFVPDTFWMHHEYAFSGWRTRVISEDVSKLATSVATVPRAEETSLVITPNPMREAVRVSFVLPAAGGARVEILDVSGRRVREIDLGGLAAGPGRVEWDGRSAAGSPVASGVYLVRVVSAGDVVGTGRVVVAR